MKNKNFNVKNNIDRSAIRYLMLGHYSINIIYLLLFISALIILGSPIFKEIHLKQMSLTYKDYHNFEFILDYHRSVQKNAIAISENALNNIFQISYDQLDFPPIESQIEYLWNNPELYHSNSHEFYSQSLTILWHFILAHEQTKDMRYLAKGRELILSWIKFNSRFDPSLSTYAWSDHSTAKRSIVVLFFMDYYETFNSIDNEFSRATNSFINNSIKYLSNSGNYSFPHNHGIYQDIALFFLSLHLDDSKKRMKYINISSNRFMKQVKKGFSASGFHLENSPGYHFLTLLKCEEFLKLSKNFNLIDDETFSILNLAEENKKLLYIDNRIPPIGDSEMTSDGQSRILKDSFFAVDSLAGYAIFTNSTKTIQVRSQGLYRTHSHNDDFSFLYSSEEGLIFTETGFLDFTNSEDRRFTLSIQAHNSLLPIYYLDDYSLDYKSKISNYVNSEEIVYFSLESNDIFHIKRNYFINNIDDCLFIQDLFTTQIHKDWIRIFNLDKNAKYDIIDDFTISITSNDCNYYIQSYKNPIHIVDGLQNPHIGWNSDDSTLLLPSPTIIQNTNSSINLLSVSRHEPINLLHFNEKEIKYSRLNETKNIIINESSIMLDDKSYQITDYQDKPISSLTRKKGLSFKRRVQLINLYIIMIFILFIITRIILRLKKPVFFFISIVIVSVTIITSSGLFFYVLRRFTF